MIILYFGIFSIHGKGLLIEKKDVIVYRLITCGTTEEKIYKMHQWFDKTMFQLWYSLDNTDGQCSSAPLGKPTT
ncbi:hypothetical protein MKX01_033621 [Papaver californicum]|nr:hypothetical protein MKX01_033621 [Papaver californicum]